jgi:AcrR family transcriptional regulator
MGTGAATRPRGRPPVEIDEAALQAAASAVFASESYFGASVEEIARRAGTSKALLFRRFSTKDALFDWTVEHEVRQLTEHLLRAYERVQGLSVRARIRAGVDALIDYATTRPSGFRLLFESGFTAGRGATPAWEKARGIVTDRNAELVRSKLEEIGAPAGPLAAGVIASAIVGACEHVARRLVEDESLDPRAASDLLTEFLSDGLRGLSAAALAAPDATHAKERR